MELIGIPRKSTELEKKAPRLMNGQVHCAPKGITMARGRFKHVSTKLIMFVGRESS